MKIAENIKANRIKLNLSQSELAKKLSLGGKTTIEAYESGRANPMIPTLVKMSELFKITIDELIKGKEYCKCKLPSFSSGFDGSIHCLNCNKSISLTEKP